jgi:hypothetical protein
LQLIEAKTSPTTLREVNSRIRQALEENGYFDSSYYAIPDGFALATRIEQINDDGTPKAGIQRWSIEVPRLARLSFTDYIHALFYAPPGYYRVIVFLITPHAFVQREEPVTAEQANHWAVEGGNLLPSSIASQHFSTEAYNCTAIIYEFARRTESDEPKILAPGRLQGRIHLEKAGGHINPMTNGITTRVCKRRLAALWFGVGLVLFRVLALQSVFNRFGDRVEEAWSWFLPSIVPTLSLIVGVLVLDFTSGTDTEKRIAPFYFWLAFLLSVVYLVLISMTLFLQPFIGVPLLDLMKRSNLWLRPLQGLVAAALGVFFVKGERGEES